MSKASEAAARYAEVVRQKDAASRALPHFGSANGQAIAEVDYDGDLVLHQTCGLCAIEALQLARWLIDTFTEAPARNDLPGWVPK